MINKESLNNIIAIFKREVSGYFESPVAYVFIVIFLLLSGFFTFNISHFFEAGQADLQGFFQWHPWLFLFLIPAVAMRLWAEERRMGTIELILTMPITVGEAIIGKFLAAWAFIAIALFLTFPMILTTLYLGEPDMGVMVCGYVGSFLMAGAFFKRGQHDLIADPQSGHQLYRGGRGLPVLYSGRISADHRILVRLGAALAAERGIGLEFSDALYFDSARRA